MASVLAMVFLISLVSATITFTNVPTLSQTEDSFTITITSNETESVDLTSTSITEGSNEITFTPQTVSLVADTAQEVTVDYTVPTNFEFELAKTYSTTLATEGTISDTATQTVSFEETDYCSYENLGELKVKIEDINNQALDHVSKGYDDDDEWYAGSQIDIELEISNEGNDDIEDVEVTWALYTQDGEEIDDGDLSDFDVDEGDEETKEFTLTINADDLDENTEDYILYISATGEIAEGDNDGEKTCTSETESIKILIENDLVVLTDIDFPEIPEAVSCGSEVHFSADVYNIGEKDQEDVTVNLIVEELNINEIVDIGDVDSFESENLDVTLNIPEETEEKTYYLRVWVLDEDNDAYENDDDDKSYFILPFKVEGSCKVQPKAVVSASLESGGKAGKELVVRSTITNSADKLITYTVSATDYSEWADSAELDIDSFALGAGETRDVVFTFNVNKDAQGDKLFNIEVSSGTDLAVKQPVSVTIEKSGFTMTGFAISGDNWYLWGIGALNIILVIIIIVVAIRVARS